MAMYTIAKRGGIIILDNESASSNKYLNNMIQTGSAVLTTFNPNKFAELENVDPDDLLNLSDDEYNELMGIVNTNVATNLSIREVADETNLKKAEAKYEADMRKINKKDKKYDTDLAKLENERNAIKTESETLKTVINDNTDRTFKLFS